MADNPIKYEDFIKPDESVEKLIKQLITLRNTYAELLGEVKKDAKELADALKSVSGATEEGKASTGKASTEAEKLAKSYQKLKDSQSETGKQLAALRLEQQKQNNLNKLEIKLNEAKEGSYNKLSAQYSINKLKLNAMSDAERKLTKEGKKLEESTKAIYEEMKSLQEATGKYSLNVGNYKNDILGALKAQNLLAKKLEETKKEFKTAPKAIKKNAQAIAEFEKEVKELEKGLDELGEVTGKTSENLDDFEDSAGSLVDQLQDLPGATGAAGSGVTSLGKTFKALLANPVVLFITILVGSLVALFSIFKKTKGGSELLAKGSAALSGVMSILTGFVDVLAKGLEALFKDPIGSLESFGKALVTNIVNRFKAVLVLGKAVGKAFMAIADRDLEALKNAGEDAGRALVQMGTGLDADQQKEFSNAVKETTNSITKQIDAFVKLEEAKKRAKTVNRELEASAAALATQEELAQAKADDATKSFAVREALARKAAKLTAERAKLELKVASRNLSLVNKEIDLRRANGEQISDLLDQQLDLYKNLEQANREYLLAIQDNQKRESELKQDRLEKDLDILIDGFDNQKTINERIIADDSRTFDEREKVLNQTKELFENTFNKQIETIQKFTGIRLNADELINESDAVALNQKIRSLGLSEIIEGRLLEIIRERRTATQDLTEAEKDLNQKRNESAIEALAIEERFQKEKYDAAANGIDEAYDLRLTEIELLKITEAEKTKLVLEAERDRLKQLLALNESGQSQLTESQLQAVRNTIAKINQELASAKDNQEFDIYSIVGLKIDDDQKQAMADAAAYTISNIQAIFSAKIQAADAAIAKAQEEKQTAEQRLEEQKALQEKGLANDVAGAKREVKLAKDKEKKNLAIKQKAQKAQAAIDTAMQVSGLITATVEIYKSLSGIPVVGPGLATAAVALMFGSYAAAKVTAASLAKEQYGEGGYEVLNGGSHASGNDIPIGITKSGKQRTAEGGEGLAIIKKSSTRKYKGLIPKLVKSLNSGNFEENFGSSILGDPRLNDFLVNANFDSKELKSMDGNIAAMRKHSENQITRYVDEKGRLVQIYKNVKTTYV